jgi:uncharacterized protein (TIGR00251 family)
MVFIESIHLVFTIEIRVKPNASKAFIGGLYGDRLVVSVNAPAVDGKANKAIIQAVADAFDVSKSSVNIISGLTSKDKKISINGNELELQEKLKELRGDLF